MKINFEDQAVGGRADAFDAPAVSGETAPLRDVVLCAPSHLAPVPCCSVTRETLRNGVEISTATALREHRALRAALTAKGVACHMIDARPDLPDMCFTRDVAVTTPWGVVVLNPAMPHRAAEADRVARSIASATRLPVERQSEGLIEGGDICIARPGLLIVGISDERTNDAGADAFAARFRSEGWDVLTYRFDPHFLHLDTIFCMADSQNALACVEVLDDRFVAALSARGIRIHPVTYKEARTLGCNILSIDGMSLLTNAATPRVGAMLRTAGFDVTELAIDQLAACGGGNPLPDDASAAGLTPFWGVDYMTSLSANASIADLWRRENRRPKLPSATPLRRLGIAGTGLLMQPSVEEQADDWIALQRYQDAADAPEVVFARGFRLNDLAYDDPAFTMSVIKDVVSRYAERDLFTDAETEAKRILGMLGAGPLETLLGENGHQVIAEVEAEAIRDRRFLWTLACVWQHGMSDDLWGRVQRITGGFSP